MNALILLYRRTGERRFLAPIPKALAYLRASRRADGKMARFYELQTNRPLYFDREYNLTYSDADMPTHYGFIVSDRSNSVERRYEEALRLQQPEPIRKRSRPRHNASLTRRAGAAIAALDDRGAWVAPAKGSGSNDPVIDSRTFIRNVGILCDFIAARPAKGG